jgi:S1-C subfamily serine protease
MSSWRSRRAFWVLGWFVVLYMLDVLLAWPSGPHVFAAAADRLLTVRDLLLSAAVVGAIVSKREVVSSRRLAAYAVVGLTASAATFAWSNPKQIRAAYAWTLKLFHGERGPLSAVEIFQRASPSVFVVEALGQDGNVAMLGSAVAVDRNLLVTNCHVANGGSFLRVSRGKEKWGATLIGAVPYHDLCGLTIDSATPEPWETMNEFRANWPDADLSDDQIRTNLQDPTKFRSAFPNYDGLTDDEIHQIITTRVKPRGPALAPVDLVPSSKLQIGERVYAIGSPEGLELTFSEGVISAFRDSEGVHLIQTSAPISPGSSGGGLFDTHGRLVGITTFQLKEGQSLNFALPGEWVTDLLEHAKSAKMAQVAANDEALESTAWVEIGLEAVKQKNYDLAEHCFHKAANLRQSDAYRAWFELGNVRLEAARDPNPTHEQDYEEAISDYEQAIRLRPDYPEAWVALASAHFRLKRWSQALIEAKEAVRLDPQNAFNWGALGTCYERVGSNEQAIDAYQRALRISPNNSGWLYGLGSAYAKNGNREQVLKIYEQIKEKDRASAEDFFRDYVLPHPAATARPQAKSQRDQLLEILRGADTDDATRQAAWDAFWAATDAGDFKKRFDTIPLPNEVKHDLWDVKFGANLPK